jgi:hypothetical protein
MKNLPVILFIRRVLASRKPSVILKNVPKAAHWKKSTIVRGKAGTEILLGFWNN